MKPFSMFTLLTIASLGIYSGNSWAQGQTGNLGPGIGMGETLAVAQYKRKVLVNTCISRLNQDLRNAGLSGSATAAPDDEGNDNFNLDSSVSSDPKSSKPLTNYNTCLSGIPPQSQDAADKSCQAAEDAIDKAADKMTEDCDSAPRVDATSLVGSDTDRVYSTKYTDSSWGVCLQDAKSCSGAYVENGTADNCFDTTVESLTRDGEGADQLQNWCQDNHPKQCGAFDSAEMSRNARDMQKDLDSSQKDLQREIEEKKKDIKDNQDKQYKDNQTLTDLPNKFQQQNQALQKSYEAKVKAENEKLDNSLEKNYKQIDADQAALEAAGAAVTQADAVKFDAQNKFMNACKKMATDYANNKTKGAVKDSANTLITYNARWSDFYTTNLQQLYADGTTCDGGNYANAQLALLNAENAQVKAAAKVQSDQNLLRIAMQKVASDKNDNINKEMINQQQDVQKMQTQQKKEQSDAIKARQDDETKAVDLQKSMQELQTKLANIPKRQQCINTYSSCASKAPSSSSSNSKRSVSNAPEDMRAIASACKRAGLACPSTAMTTDSLKAAFPDLQDPQNYVGWDNNGECQAAISAKNAENMTVKQSRQQRGVR